MPSKRPEDLRAEDAEETSDNSGGWCKVCDRRSRLTYKCDKCGKPF